MLNNFNFYEIHTKYSVKLIAYIVLPVILVVQILHQESDQGKNWTYIE